MSGIKSTRRSKPTARSSNFRTSGLRTKSSYVTRSEIKGHKFSPGINPPDVEYQPWTRVTLVKPFVTNIPLKVDGIRDIMKAQLDPTKRGFNQDTSGDDMFVVQFRLHSVAAWNLTGRNVALSVEDFSNPTTGKGGRDQLCGLVDIGTQNHTPAIGYHLPMSHQNLVLRTDSVQGGMYLFEVMASKEDSGVVYITISYRFDGPVKSPSIFSINAEILMSTNKLVNSNKTIKRLLAAIEALTKQMKDNQPSVVKSVLDDAIVGAVPTIAIAAIGSSDSDDSPLTDEQISKFLERLSLSCDH